MINTVNNMLNNIKVKHIFFNDPQQMKILETIIFKEEELKKLTVNKIK